MTGEPRAGSYASPPCFLHELDAAHGGLAPEPDPVQARDVARWRKAERSRLLAARAALPLAQREVAAAAIAGHLENMLGEVAGKVIAGYWPIKSELDLRPWLSSLRARGAIVVLPVVTQKAAPLQFRAWNPEGRMERGFWDILVPAEGEWLVPDIVIAPVVGFDRSCFRLGYSGGYFDRTLAALGGTCAPIGVGLAASRMATIFPQPHDIAMREVVTEIGISYPET